MRGIKELDYYIQWYLKKYTQDVLFARQYTNEKLRNNKEVIFEANKHTTNTLVFD